jgi:hypothetical protein
MLKNNQDDILRMPDFECDEFETERAGCRLPGDRQIEA